MYSALALLLAAASAWGSDGDVRSICEKTGTEVLELTYRDRDANINMIKSRSLGKSAMANYLRAIYTPTIVGRDAAKLQLVADKGDAQFIPDSNLKRKALRYSFGYKRDDDPEGFRKALFESFRELIPKEFNRLDWFFGIKDPEIESSQVRVGTTSEIGESYGGLTRLVPTESGKYRLEIIMSSNESESLPYSIVLLAHELQHAIEYKRQMAMWGDEKKYGETQFIDEALANDVEMRVYVELIKKDPALFCNWLYVTWAYGDLVIPLSWAMASTEAEMRERKFMFNYARAGNYKSQVSLLREDQKALRPQIQKRITDLNLQYVK